MWKDDKKVLQRTKQKSNLRLPQTRRHTKSDKFSTNVMLNFHEVLVTNQINTLFQMTDVSLPGW